MFIVRCKHYKTITKPCQYISHKKLWENKNPIKTVGKTTFLYPIKNCGKNDIHKIRYNSYIRNSLAFGKGDLKIEQIQYKYQPRTI